MVTRREWEKEWERMGERVGGAVPKPTADAMAHDLWWGKYNRYLTLYFSTIREFKLLKVYLSKVLFKMHSSCKVFKGF